MNKRHNDRPQARTLSRRPGIPSRLGFLLLKPLIPWMFRTRQKTMENNLDLVFGDFLPLSRRREIMLRSWENLWRSIWEVLYFPWAKTACLETMQPINFEALDQSLSRGKGVVLAAVHTGNWFWGAACLAQRYPVYVMIRPLSLRLGQAVLNRVFQRMGFHTISRVGGLYRAFQALRQNAIVIIALDQHASNGVWIDFFGRPASTFTSPAALALLQDCPVHLGFVNRQAGNRQEVRISDPFPLIQTGNRKQDTIANTLLFSRAVEKIIQDYPDTWLWMHRRWKPACNSPVFNYKFLNELQTNLPQSAEILMERRLDSPGDGLPHLPGSIRPEFCTGVEIPLDKPAEHGLKFEK